MSFLWEGVKATAKLAGDAALATGHKAKLQAEILLSDRDEKARKQRFGIELYDYVCPLAKNPDFFAADDKMTDTIRGPVLKAQREIAALEIKRGKLKEKLAQAEITRKAAFPTPASNFGEKVFNTGKAVTFAGNETKIATEIAMLETQINAHKQDFGLELFDVFVHLEDEEGWLPTVRDIRSMYDQARRDVEKIRSQKQVKQKQLEEMGGPSLSSSSTPTAAAGQQQQQTRGRSQSPTRSGGGGVVGGFGLSSVPAPQQQSSMGTTSYISPSPASAPAPALHAAASGMFSYGSTRTTATAVTYNNNDPFAGAPAGQPVAAAVPAPATYDPFLNAPPPQVTAASSAGFDPFTGQPVAQQPAAAGYDPFAAAAPAATNNNNTSDDPFAGL